MKNEPANNTRFASEHRISLFLFAGLLIIGFSLSFVCRRAINQHELGVKLLQAISMNNAQQVRSLLQEGANPDYSDYGAQSPSFIDKLKRLFVKNRVDTAIVQAMSRSVIDPAERRQRETIVRYHIEAGADPTMKDRYGYRLLDGPAVSWSAETIILLIKHGALKGMSPESKVFLFTEVPEAARIELLKNGVNINGKLMDNGYTPLRMAKDVEDVEWYLAHGADPTVKDISGQSMLTSLQNCVSGHGPTEYTEPFLAEEMLEVIKRHGYGTK